MEANYTLIDIQTNTSYIEKLNSNLNLNLNSKKGNSVRELIDYAHSLSPELKLWYENNKDNFKLSSIKDKGALGKILETSLFANLPNNKSLPDTLIGDIKVGHLKKLKNNYYNAKERQTITNIGDPEKEATIATFMDKNAFQDTKYWLKMKWGILFLIEEEKSVQCSTIDDLYNKKVFGVIRYNLDELFIRFPEISFICQEDFMKIKTCILDKKVSQKGQQYIHIHKHGCKNSSTRAIGFTNKFVTLLYSIYSHTPLLTKGRSSYITPLIT
jgi:hypothetical protein